MENAPAKKRDNKESQSLVNTIVFHFNDAYGLYFNNSLLISLYSIRPFS